MRLLVLFSLFLFFSSLYGQTKYLQIPNGRNNDTSLLYKWKQNNAQRMKLEDLTKSTDKIHFRLWEENQVVEIWSNDLITFQGFLLNFTNKIYGKKRRAPSIFRSEIPIDTIIARQIYNIFIDNSIFNIPTDDSVKGWGQGCDGEEFLIEYSTNTFYSFKEYWTPSVFKELREAVVIENMINRLDTILQVQKNWEDFFKSLPKGCYRVGEIVTCCKY